MTWWHSKRVRERQREREGVRERSPPQLDAYAPFACACSDLDVCPSFVNFFMFSWQAEGQRSGSRGRGSGSCHRLPECRQNPQACAPFASQSQIAVKLVGLSITHAQAEAEAEADCNCNWRCCMPPQCGILWHCNWQM